MVILFRITLVVLGLLLLSCAPPSRYSFYENKPKPVYVSQLDRWVNYPDCEGFNVYFSGGAVEKDLNLTSPVALFVEPPKFVEYSISAKIAEEVITGGILNSGKAVVARTDIARVIEEQKFRASEITESEAKKLGKILGANDIVIVKILTSHSQIYKKDARFREYEEGLTVRVLDVTSGAVKFSSTLSIETLDGMSKNSALMTIYDLVAEMLFFEIPKNQKSLEI